MKQTLKMNKENLEVTTILTEKEFRDYHFSRGVFAVGFAFGITFLFMSFFIFSFAFKFVSLVALVISIVAVAQSKPKSQLKFKGGKKWKTKRK